MTRREHPWAYGTGWAAAALVGSLASVGCEDDAASLAPVASSSAPAPIPSALQPLEVRRGEERLPIRSALAFGTVGSKISLHLSTEQDDCRAVRDDRAKGGSVIELALDPTLRPNGDVVWTAVSPVVSGADATVYASTVDMQATDVESEVQATLDVELRPRGGDRTPIHLKGPLRARPCGRVGDAPPPAKPQKDLSVTVAGRTFAMQAAVLSVEGPEEFSITVSSAPRGCGMTDAVGDVELKITAKGDPAKVTGAYLYGELVDGEIRVEPPEDALEIDIENPGETATRVTMKGRYDHDGLTVKLDGHAAAVVCLP